MDGSTISDTGSPGAAFMIAKERMVIPNRIGIDISVLRIMYVTIFYSPFIMDFKNQGEEHPLSL